LPEPGVRPRPGFLGQRARTRLRRPPLQAGEFVRWPRETPLLPVLTAKIVPHMFRIMLTGVLPRTPVLLIIPSAVDPPVRERARPSRSRCSTLPDERS
jgi:hypothetical protein